MSPNIDNVIEVCEKRYKLIVNGINEKRYMEFIKRQLDKHTEYDLDYAVLNARKNPYPFPYPYIVLMSNKLYLFSILGGETPIKTKIKEVPIEKRILAPNDLYLLRPSEFGAVAGSNLAPINKSKVRKNRQSDERLLLLYHSITNNYRKNSEIFPFPNWSSLINELGRDLEIIEYFNGQIITYKMVLKCPSPNVKSHGGYRGD